MRPGRAWPLRLLVAVVAVACLAAGVLSMRQRSEALARRDAADAAAAADRAATRVDEDRIADLQRSIAAVRSERDRDQAASTRIGEVIEEIGTLRTRLTQAETDLVGWRDASADRAAQIEVIRACVQTLDAVRTHLLDGDGTGATATLGRGRPSCRRAEELTDGIVTAVHPFDFPDPSVLTVDRTYYAFGTNGPAGTVQVVTSTDLDRWDVAGSALTSVPGWAMPGFTWAPSALRTPSGYVLYYAVRHAASGRQCITVATATAPAGPYVDRSTGPLVCQLDLGGSIDPSPYQDEHGALYLAWKSEGETVGGAAQIWTRPLDAAGTGLTWFPTPLLTTDRPWEGRVVEAPSMVRIDGEWVLLYSGNSWDTDRYAIGYARCEGPVGPCHKPEQNVALRSDGTLEGPGGAEAFRTADGRVMIAYAGWDAGDVGPPNPRRLHLARLTLTAAGLRVS